MTGCFNFDRFFFFALTRRFLHLGFCGELINDALLSGVKVTRNLVGAAVISGKISRAGGLGLAGVEGVALDGAARRGAALPGGVGVVSALLGLGLGELLVTGLAGLASAGLALVTEGELDIRQGLGPLPPDGVGGVRRTLPLPLLGPGEGPLLLRQHRQFGPHEAVREARPREECRENVRGSVSSLTFGRWSTRPECCPC